MKPTACTGVEGHGVCSSRLALPPPPCWSGYTHLHPARRTSHRGHRQEPAGPPGCGEDGAPQADAAKRVSDVLADARQAADTARKAAAHALLWAFLAFLIGALCASVAATIGGGQRDRVAAAWAQGCRAGQDARPRRGSDTDLGPD